MNGFVYVVTIVLVAAYTLFSLWMVCKRRTLAGSLCTTLGLLCGSLVISSVAAAVAAILYYALIIVLALVVLYVLFC